MKFKCKKNKEIKKRKKRKQLNCFEFRCPDANHVDISGRSKRPLDSRFV